MQVSVRANVRVSVLYIYQSFPTKKHKLYVCKMEATCKWLTGLESQIMLMNCSLCDDLSYTIVMLQLLTIAGAMEIQRHSMMVVNED